jgi:hypothetical protein
MACSFEFPIAWKNGIVSGYPNPTGNLLTINFRTTFPSGLPDSVFLLGYAERIVRANFNGSAFSIDY